MARRLSANAALVLAGIIGGVSPIASHLALRELSPFTLLLGRLLVMNVALSTTLPPMLRTATRRPPVVWLLAGLWTANVCFYLFALKATSATFVQLLYACSPVVVVLGSLFWLRERPSRLRLLGTAVALGGAVIIIEANRVDEPLQATTLGVIFAAFGATCWGSYLLLSKKFGPIRPLDVTAASAVVALLATTAVVFALGGPTLADGRALALPEVGAGTLTALAFLGLVVSIAMVGLYQWGVARGSPVVAASMLHLSTLTTAAIDVAVFERVLSPTAIVGGLAILGGVGLATSSKH